MHFYRRNDWETHPDHDGTVTRLPRAAAFLVRAWWEDGNFRARISYSTDVTSTTLETKVVTAEPETIYQHLAKWLREAAPEGQG